MKFKITAAVLAVIMIFVSVPLIFADSEIKNVYQGEGTVIAVLDNGFNIDHYLFKLPKDTKTKLDKAEISKLLVSTSAYQKAKNIIKSTYISDKIPFAFDYTANSLKFDSPYSSGTQTASVIGAYISSDAAKGEPGFSGAAPASQLLLMKVSSGETENNVMNGETVARAISDAVILGSDVIYINTSENPQLAEDENFINAVAKARRDGVVVFAGAGNGGLIGTDSIYDLAYGIPAPLAANTDYGTQSKFSKIPSLVTVASSDNPMNNIYSFILGKIAESEDEVEAETETEADIDSEESLDKNVIEFSDTNVTYGTSGGKTFIQYFTEMDLLQNEIEYVVIDGIGSKEDFAKLDQGSLDGKIALVARGEIPFTDKINNAAEFGAVGVIVYESNPDETAGVMMSIEGAEIPAIFISYKSGQKLLEAEEKIITIPIPDEDVIQISDYASTGATDILTIGPDFITEGNYIKAATGNNGIDTFGGNTQYSAAKAAGIYACIKGCLISRGYSSTGKDLCDTVLRLMSSSAVPVTDDDGIEISPKIQGSGTADVYSAVNSGAVIYNTETKESKTEIGQNKKLFAKPDKGGDFATLYVTVENITDKKVSYDLSVSVLTDKAVTFDRDELYADGDNLYDVTGFYSDVLFGFDPDAPLPHFVTGFSEEISGASVTSGDFNRYLNRASEKFNAQRITLEAGQKVELELKISFDSETLKKYSTLFENGFFVEGYVYLTPSNGEGSVISHPYMGFCGDWAKSPIVSEKAYDSPGAYYGDNMLIVNIDSDYYYGPIMLGQNYLISVDSDSGANDESLCAISPYMTYDESEYGYPDGLCWAVTPLRDITSHTVKIKSADTGKIIYTANLGAIARGTKGKNGLVEPYIERLWSCSSDDNKAFVYPDGKYICEITMYTKLGSDNLETGSLGEVITQTVSFAFSIDTKAPEVCDVKLAEIDGSMYFEVTAKDENYVQAIFLHDGYADYPCDDSPLKPAAVVENGRGNEITITFDASMFYTISDTDESEEGASYIYVEVVDYAHNSSVYRFSRAELLS